MTGSGAALRSRGWSGPLSGYSLIEALLALTLVGFALTLTLPLLALEMRLEQRHEARREVRALVEVAVEQVRATGDLELVELVEIESRPRVARELDLEATLETEPGPPGLLRLEVTARWLVGGQSDQLEQVTLMWVDQ